MASPMRGFTIGLLPGSAELKRNELRALVVGFSVLVVVVAVTVANGVFGVGGRAVGTVIRDWLSCVVYMLVAGIVALRAIRGRTHRRSWALFAVGLALYALGDVLWSAWIGHLPNPPITDSRSKRIRASRKGRPTTNPRSRRNV
jgi:hypothetical protein